MKFNKWRFIKDRLYEIYAYLARDGFMFAVTIDDIDFQIHLLNCREPMDRYLGNPHRKSCR